MPPPTLMASKFARSRVSLSCPAAGNVTANSVDRALMLFFMFLASPESIEPLRTAGRASLQAALSYAPRAFLVSPGAYNDQLRRAHVNAARLPRLGALAALLALPALAHHGVAPHYDDSQHVTIDGTVSEFQFINPHAFVYLRVVGNDGKEAIWHCELASRSVLARNGLTAEMFAPGKHVRITGSQARQNPTGCAVREAHFDDGSVLRSSTLFGATPATTAVPEAQRESIEGVWAMKRFAVSRYIGALTDEGERLRAAFDPIKDDPAIYCDPASPVRDRKSVV